MLVVKEILFHSGKSGKARFFETTLALFHIGTAFFEEFLILQDTAPLSDLLFCFKRGRQLSCLNRTSRGCCV